MRTSEITEGHWTYSRQSMWASWTITDSRTGEQHDTGALTIVDARRFAHQLGQADAVTYTMASGPQRARAGHQRRRAWDFA